MQIRGDLSGAKELEDALKELPKAMSKAVLTRALKKAAAPVAALASDLAPRGATGNLAISIEVGTKLKESQRKGGVKSGDVEIYIGATTPKGAHAHLVEFGTDHSPPHPFMRPAWDQLKETVVSLIGREIWAALAKSARTLARKSAKGTLSKSARRALGG